MAASSGNLCVITNGGAVRCVGDWPIGVETPTEIGSHNQGLTAPLEVKGLTGAKELRLTSNRGCAIMSDASVQCWGNTRASKNAWSGATPGDLSPSLAFGIADVVDLALTSQRSCAVRTDHSVICWGAPLGAHGRQPGPADPPRVRAVVPVTQISGDGGRFCARTTSAGVVCWDTDDGATTAVAGLRDVAEVRVAPDYACARSVGGEISCWGSNVNGGLGDGTTTARTGVVKVAGITGAIALDVSSTFACALAGDGKVQCWGETANCNLGAAPTSTCTKRTMGATTGAVELTFCAPTPIAPHVAAKHLVVGSTTACVWDDAGAAECWGLDLRGRAPQCTPVAL